ncbi:MAG: nuclear transport factor 2 family protein [Pseudomonadota bacterium]
MTMAASRVLEIEAACQRVIYAAAAFIDGNDFGSFSELFVEGGSLQRPDGSVLTGREAILAAYQARPASRMSLHVISNTRFSDVSENGCQATSLVTLWASDSRSEAGPQGRAVVQPLVLGEFDDCFVLDGGVWRFASRKAAFLMHAPKPA